MTAARILLALALAGAGAAAAEPAGGTASLTVHPTEATVGDRLEAVLTLDLPADVKLEPPSVGPSLGPFEVVSGSWSAPVEQGGRRRSTWTGAVTKFEPGVFEIPAIAIPLGGGAGAAVVRTDPVTVTLRSVLPAESTPPGGAPPDLADLKAPAAVAPNYRPLRGALVALGVLLLAAAAAWWLHRRYAARLAAVGAPEDPFHRIAPHDWAYGELQRLLERRLPEAGEVDLFFAEISRILKRYLGGRFRVELMERTTAEVVPLLRQAAAPAGPIAEARVLLELCDLVKFAREAPAPETCRQVVEQTYRVVDLTRPVDDAAPARAAAGAA